MKARPPTSLEEILGKIGVTETTRDRWANELAQCTTEYQVQLVADCHRLETFLRARYSR
jgi:hypothetical protein